MNSEVQNIVHFNFKCTEIVNKLIEIRKQIPMTQSEVAIWLNVDRRKIIDIENGKLNVPLMLEYADKFSVNINLTFEIN